MSKIELNPIRSNYASTSVLNDNFEKIESGIDDALSRTGKGPNQMESVLDMNKNYIINLPKANQPGMPVTYDQLNPDTQEVVVVPVGPDELSDNPDDQQEIVRKIGAVQHLENIDALRGALKPSGASAVVTIEGYYTPDDGGGGQFFWDPSSTEVDDGGMVLASDAGGAGRWKRLLFGQRVDLRFFGAKGDGTGDDGPAAQRWLDYGQARGSDLYASAGRYRIATALACEGTDSDTDASPAPVIRGAGMGRTIFIDAVSDDAMLFVHRSAGKSLRGFTLEDLSVLPDVGATNQSGVRLQGPWLSTFRRVSIKKLNGTAVVLGDDTDTINPDETATAMCLFESCEFDENFGGIHSPVNNNAPHISLLNTSIRSNRRFGLVANSSYVMIRGGSISGNGLTDAANALGGVVIREEAGTSYSVGYRAKGILIENCELDTNYPYQVDMQRGEVPIIRGCSIQFRDYSTLPWASYGITHWPKAQIRVGGTVITDRAWRTVIEKNRFSIQSDGVLAFNGHAMVFIDTYGLSTEFHDNMMNLDLGSGIAGVDFFIIREPSKVAAGFTERKSYVTYDYPALNVAPSQYKALFNVHFPIIHPAYNANRDFGFRLEDDTAIAIDTPANGAEQGVGAGVSFGWLALVTGGSQTGSDIILYRAMSGPVCFKLGSASTNLNVTTGPLTGTTGADGKLTVSAATDGKIYIENRLGGPQNVQVSFLQAPGPYGQAS